MAELGLIERLLVNNPVYVWFQRREVANLRRLAPPDEGANILDLGCGRGVELELIAQLFRPRSLLAFDRDPRQVRLARTYLRSRGGKAALLLADASRLPFGDGQFDAVVEMAVLHHVEDWRSALREVARVLKPGGLFYFLDISLRRFNWFFRLLGHDVSYFFSREDFQGALAEAGLHTEDGLRPSATPVFEFAGVARKAS